MGKEIKCPFKGAQMNIKDAIDKEFKQCLDVRGEKYVLKQRNKLYGQVQLNMAVLNVKTASFAMFASFDKSLEVLSVSIDEPFLIEMLTVLKSFYYNIFIPYICPESLEEKENVDRNE